MADEDASAGFLSRWSKRKTDVREGRAVVEDKRVSVATSSPNPKGATPSAPTVLTATSATSATSSTSAQPSKPDAPAPTAPVPTMDDVQHLHADSNYASFMSHKVATEVKNAAMKKLFADPHFNVMDGLDIYIDDYSQPDPLPAGMLQQMTRMDGVHWLDDPNTGDTTAGQPEVPAPSDVAQLSPIEPPSTPTQDTTAHDHADLRLQPNPAARPQGAEPKPE